MKRMTFLLLAALTALFAVLVALDVINFETDRIDRWVMIVGFAGVAFFVGLASADSSHGPSTSQRAGIDQATAARQEDRSALPARPGSLVRSSGPAADREELEELEEPTLDLVALETDPVDAELREMMDDDQLDRMDDISMDDVSMDDISMDQMDQIDEDQMDEIAALVDRPEPDAVEHLSASDAVAEAVGDDRMIDPHTIDPAIQPIPQRVPADLEASTDGPIARIELRLADYDDEALQKLVKDSEAIVIAEMVRTGQLTSAGELTERDIASMVFLSYTSDEMLAELRLRKSLDQPGEVAVTDRALAPLKNIE